MTQKRANFLSAETRRAIVVTRGPAENGTRFFNVPDLTSSVKRRLLAQATGRFSRSAGALRSIEPSLCAILKLANPLALGVMSPAGMEPAGAGDIDEAPQGRAFGRNASQSNLRFALSLSWPTLWPFELCPRREWSRGSERHRRSPAGVSFREKANQSNLCAAQPLSWPLQNIPGGNGAAGKRATWTKPAGSKRGSAEINRTFVWTHH